MKVNTTNENVTKVRKIFKDFQRMSVEEFNGIYSYKEIIDTIRDAYADSDIPVESKLVLDILGDDEISRNNDLLNILMILQAFSPKDFIFFGKLIMDMSPIEMNPKEVVDLIFKFITTNIKGDDYAVIANFMVKDMGVHGFDASKIKFNT